MLLQLDQDRRLHDAMAALSKLVADRRDRRAIAEDLEKLAVALARRRRLSKSLPDRERPPRLVAEDAARVARERSDAESKKYLDEIEALDHLAATAAPGVDVISIREKAARARNRQVFLQALRPENGTGRLR